MSPRGWAVAVAAALLGACLRTTERLAPASAPDGAAPGPWNCGPRCFSDGVPSTAVSGPVAAGGEPGLVYPLPGAVLPPNLRGITLQWTRASDVTQTAFRIALAGPVQRYELHVPCGRPSGTMTPPASTQCVYTPPDPVWRAIALESAGQSMAVTVSASDGQGGPVASSAPVTVAFAGAAVPGGVYFWSYRDGGLYRAPFGARTATELVAPGTPANRRSCAGCHSVSRDGKVIAFSAGDASDAPGSLTTAPVAAPAASLIAPASPPVPDGTTVSLNGDGTLVAVSYGSSGSDSGHLVVRDAATGAEVARLDPSVLGTVQRRVLFPEWDPDGTRLVATLSREGRDARTVTDGIIAVIPYDGGRFGPATVVVPEDPGGLVHYYPSWSPDGALILFVSARAPGRLGNDVSYDNPSARLRLARSDGSAVYELGRASATTAAGGDTAGWPRFVASAAPPWFFTFHSKRDYGFVLPNHQVAGPKGGLSQLWLASIDPARLPGDPSSAPVWLPLQDVQQINNMPFPARILCAPAALPPTGCGPGETCRDGECHVVSE